MAAIALSQNNSIFLHIYRSKNAQFRSYFCILVKIDYISVSALKMLKACLSIFFQFCRILLFLNFIEFIA